MMNNQHSPSQPKTGMLVNQELAINRVNCLKNEMRAQPKKCNYRPGNLNREVHDNVI